MLVLSGNMNDFVRQVSSLTLFEGSAFKKKSRGILNIHLSVCFIRAKRHETSAKNMKPVFVFVQFLFFLNDISPSKSKCLK